MLIEENPHILWFFGIMWFSLEKIVPCDFHFPRDAKKEPAIFIFIFKCGCFPEKFSLKPKCVLILLLSYIELISLMV